MAWKITFNYSDGGRVKITNRKPLDGENAIRYYLQYGRMSDGGMYQEYPFCRNEPRKLLDVINELKAWESLDITQEMWEKALQLIDEAAKTVKEKIHEAETGRLPENHEGNS